MQTVVETPNTSELRSRFSLKPSVRILWRRLAPNQKRVISCREPVAIVNGGSGGRGWASVGVRVVYLYCGRDFPIFLITVYAKAQKGDLSKPEQNALAKIAKSFFADYGRGA
jgi:hypothetical protein